MLYSGLNQACIYHLFIHMFLIYNNFMALLIVYYTLMAFSPAYFANSVCVPSQRFSK